MFTGIIEKTLPVIAIADGSSFRHLSLPNAWIDVKLGESISLNGVCLTVAKLSADSFGFDAIPETLAKTNLGLLKPGDLVHVERSLVVGSRIDGHFVQGHVDGTAPLLAILGDNDEFRLRIASPPGLSKYLVPKGSVTIDGVSLTIASLTGSDFEVALIPTTLSLTALGRRPVGWPFNIECDILSKTIVTHLERMKGSIP